MSAKPDLNTCHIEVENKHGETVKSTSGKVTSCEFETNTYTNIQPDKLLKFTLQATFVNKTDLSDPLPVYIDSSATNVGIVKGTARIFVQLLNGLYWLFVFSF